MVHQTAMRAVQVGTRLPLDFFIFHSLILLGRLRLTGRMVLGGF